MIERYDWLLFDADDTLFHFDGSLGLEALFNSFDAVFTPDDFKQFQTLNKPLWDQYAQGLVTADEVQIRRFVPLAQRFGVTAEQLNSDFIDAMAELCEPLPGALNLVHALSERVQLGIITNGFTELQDRRMRRVGFDRHFDLLVISEQVGVAKPHLDIFEHAFARMNNPARERILMVGDNLHTDVAGGRNAGIDTCWLNHHGKAAPAELQPTYEVSNLLQLHQLLLGAA
ncbi:pyrimidine 5'-nucleotidase [Pseudidiomarina mangrovi]|uniref:pyrimidine 5'-nucleotidase n=1 Tax=Pseudidiomarina mangrovi TaxID=2487133 RepID=UPI000FC9A287|nr:pyrimidine 5'-nucleotidase [Pseudidiomarina mangrovi]